MLLQKNKIAKNPSKQGFLASAISIIDMVARRVYSKRNAFNDVKSDKMWERQWEAPLYARDRLRVKIRRHSKEIQKKVEMPTNGIHRVESQ